MALIMAGNRVVKRGLLQETNSNTWLVEVELVENF
jgi:hypothetical protein